MPTTLRLIEPSATPYLVSGIPHHQVGEVWPEVAPILKRAVERDRRHSLDTVRLGLEDSTLQLWVIFRETVEGVAVTRIAQHDTGIRSVVVEFVAGDNLKDWKHLWDIVEAWAKMMDCRFAEMVGRPGWERMVPGWDRKGIEMVKDFGNDQ
jgi:hypothetical protein